MSLAKVYGDFNCMYAYSFTLLNKCKCVILFFTCISFSTVYKVTRYLFLMLCAHQPRSGPTPPGLPAPWLPLDTGLCAATFLMAYHDPGRLRVRHPLHGMCAEQDSLTSSGWSPSTTPCPSRSLGSHITGLSHGSPPSDGNTTILTVVDRFSKAAHLISLPKLHSAKETAQLMVQHVSRRTWSPTGVLSSHPGS